MIGGVSSYSEGAHIDNLMEKLRVCEQFKNDNFMDNLSNLEELKSKLANEKLDNIGHSKIYELAEKYNIS